MLKRVKSLRSPESLGLPVVLAIFGPFSFSTGAITWSITSRRRYLGTRGEYIFGHRPLPVSSPFAGASPAMRKVMFRAVCPGARSDLAPAPVAGVENIDIDKLINQHVNGPNGITVYRLP